MRKLIFMFAIIASLSFMSCGNSTCSTKATTDTDTIMVDSLDSVSDTTVVDSTVCPDSTFISLDFSL